MLKYLYELNYEYDNDLLLKEAMHSKWDNFKDPSNNHIFQHWYYTKVDNGYAQEITNFFSNKINVNIKPRFFYQKAGWTLKFHKDRGTECSVNFILNNTKDCISFKDKTFFYKCALLNTQEEHAIINPQNDRIMLKLSIFDKSYYEVLECITA